MTQNGAGVNALEDYKSTPLHYAAWYNKNTDFVKALIEKGASVNALDYNKSRPL